ncbi:MAG: hypothetical protein H6699_00905 [Myxococcales bacterium]|nr:hypothetical protein [Myxococcales bacterium]
MRYVLAVDPEPPAWALGLVDGIAAAGGELVELHGTRQPDLLARVLGGGAREVDFILDLTAFGAHAAIRDGARWGVWRLVVGGMNAAAPQAGVAEMASGAPATQVALLGIGGTIGDHEVLINDAWIRTDNYLRARLIERATELSVDLVAVAATALRFGQLPAELPTPPLQTPHLPRVRMAEHSLRGFVSAQLAALQSDHWAVGVVDYPIHRFLDPAFRPRVDWLPSPTRDIFGADPFGRPLPGGGLEVAYERFDYRLGRGVIAVVERTSPGTWSAPRVVLAGDTHLSYPFIVTTDQGTIAYPENAAAGQIRGYAVGAARWRPVTVSHPFPGLDPTVFEHDGLWWLFATDARREPVASLYVFYSQTPLGPWTAHALNPVKNDVRSTRPGGTPFRYQDALYRPAQDGAAGYGTALTICRIDRLTPTEFDEVAVARVLPTAGFPDGLHTLSAAGPHHTLLDGKRRLVVPSTVPHRLSARASRIKEALRGRSD